MDVNKLSYVIRSKNRRKILLALEKDKIPSQLTKELKIQDSNVARTLRELENIQLIKCLTKDSMGKIFQLTSEGKEVRKELIKMDLNE